MTAYDRLNKLIAYMSDNSFPATIANLASKIGVYEEQVQIDIEFLQKFELPKGNRFFASHIDISYIDGKPCYHLSNLPYTSSNTKIISASFLEYQLVEMTSQLRIGLNPQDFYSNIYSFSSQSDKEVFMHETEDINETLYTYKLPLLQADIGHYIDTLQKLKTAIYLGASVKISHQQNKNKNIIMQPQFIKKDINTGHYYALQTYQEDNYLTALSLEDIVDCSLEGYPTDSPFINPDDLVKKCNKTTSKSPISPETLHRIHCIWSFEYEIAEDLLDVEPSHVKLKIFNDNNSLLTTIKRIMEDRPQAKLTGPFSNTSSKTDSTRFYYYEDDIIGMTSFKHWLMQFSSSIIVLEPKELAYDIYNSINKNT